MKKTLRKQLITKLDKLSKDVVRKRDGNICQRCGKWVEGSNRQCSHVIPVSAGSRLRWEPLNMKVLCYHCHLSWWHKNPMRAKDWFEQQFPDRWVFLDEQDKLGSKKFSLTELEELVESLTNQLQ